MGAVFQIYIRIVNYFKFMELPTVEAIGPDAKEQEDKKENLLEVPGAKKHSIS